MNTTLTNWIYDRLYDMRLSASEASLQAGKNAAYISQLKAGENLGVDGAFGLARVFHVTPGYLLHIAVYDEIPQGEEAIRLLTEDQDFIELAKLWYRLDPKDRTSVVRMVAAITPPD